VSVYSRLATAYRKVPEPARRWTIEHMPRPLLHVRQRALRALEARAKRDELYDGDYYENTVDPIMLGSAEAMARSIAREFEPRSVIDVGCGSGGLMEALERQDVRCVGFDAADAAIDRCRARGLTARKLVIGRDPVPSDRADVALSTEVAEHVPESAADALVDLIAALAPVVLFTAAMPGSSGRGHVNEQPNEYWIARFQMRGFSYQPDLARRLREEWRAAGVDEAFHSSLMIFRTSGAGASG
jgi:SAM-dependent methyltransferase